MKLHRQLPLVGWYLGTIQYCAGLFGGGALWLLAALGTGFFWDDPAAQGCAGLLLLALIAGEAGWAYRSTGGTAPRNSAGDFLVDLVSSAAIAAFGMAVVYAILLWLPG